MNFFVADPHWGIWIILYFFVGGIAGVFLATPIYDLVQSIPGVVAIESVVLFVGADFRIDFSISPLFCIPRNTWLAFDPTNGVAVTPAAPIGAISATRTEGC